VLNPEHFAISLARAVELFRSHPNAVTEQKSALRALVALTKLGPAEVVARGDAVMVMGAMVPGTLPGIPTLAARMCAHGAREIRFERDASAADLLAVLRGLAKGPDANGAYPHLRVGHAGGVTVLNVGADRLARLGRPVSVTEAFDAAPMLAAADPPTSPAEEPSDPLAAAMARLEAGSSGPDVLDRVTTAGLCIASRMKEGDLPDAVRAIARLIALEADLPQGAARRSFGIVLERLLEPELLTAVATTVGEAGRADAAIVVLRRAGAAGASVVLRRVAAAADDPDHQRAVYRALGLIGSPDAVRALIAAAQSGGRILGRKPRGIRLAAIEGLGLVRGPAAQGTLEALRGDADTAVRAAATAALRGQRGEDE
jgi:hypothetical protein